MRSKSQAIKSAVVATMTVVSLGLLAPGCALLEGALALLGIQLLGVTPANDFGSTGNLEFSLLPVGEGGGVSLSSLEEAGIDVSVENEDGTSNDCDFVDEDINRASTFNAVAVVIDDSGSMERSYPREEFGDLCETCPHDPNRMRAQAAEELLGIVQNQAPMSRVAVMDFGPDPDPGQDATRILAPFNTGNAWEPALDRIDGTQMAGTPMWDSLAEIVLMLDEDANEYEDVLRQSGQLGADANEDGGFNPRVNDDDSDSEDESASEDENEDEESDDATADADEPSDDSNTGGPTQTDPNDGLGTDDEDGAYAPTTTDVKRFIVVVSDGDDRDSDDYTLDQLIDLAIAHDVTIHAIGLGAASAAAQDPRLLSQGQTQAVQNLQRLAEATGGYYAAAEDSDALVSMYNSIANSLAEGYAVETYSCTPSDESGEPIEPQAMVSGQRIRGQLSFGGISVPWSSIVP